MILYQFINPSRCRVEDKLYYYFLARVARIDFSMNTKGQVYSPNIEMMQMQLEIETISKSENSASINPDNPLRTVNIKRERIRPIFKTFSLTMYETSTCEMLIIICKLHIDCKVRSLESKHSKNMNENIPIEKDLIILEINRSTHCI